MSEELDAGVEHSIHVKSKQVWVAEITPEASFRLTENNGPSLEHDYEISVSYQCECGARFLKAETAREHLEGASNER